MNFKKIYGLILGVVAAGLTSCSSDLNNEEKAPVSPNETAKRTLSISTGDAKTRSEVKIDADNKWVTGDKFMAYNRTFTGPSSESRYGMLTASSTGTRTTLEGVIACKDNDELGIFYPGTFVTGHDQGKMPVNMTASYINDNKGQDGSVENLKYFDYSYGKGTVTVNGASASGSVDMKKLYSILELDFTAGGVKLKNIKKLVLSNVYTEAVYNIPNNELENYETGAINVNSPVALEKVYVAILPQKGFSPTFEVYTTDNKSYRFAVNAPNFNLVAAKVYPFTVQVKEFTPNPPYIEIGDVKWGKYNLQYTPGSKNSGWVDGYHLAKNPWDFFYVNESPAKLDVTAVYDANNASRLGDQQKWDYFRWGDISKAHNYANINREHYSKSTTGISGQILDSEYGDIATYASKNNWRMPTMKEYEDLMKNTTQYAGYIDIDGHRIYGSLFIPDGVAHGYVVPNGVTVKKNASGVITNKNQLIVSNKTKSTIAKSKLEAFTQEKIAKGIFFPAAGSFGTYSDGKPELLYPGNRGIYWTADPRADTKQDIQAYSFVFGVLGPDYYLATVGNAGAKGDLPAKQDMYSIRPIYIGQ